MAPWQHRAWPARGLRPSSKRLRKVAALPGNATRGHFAVVNARRRGPGGRAGRQARAPLAIKRPAIGKHLIVGLLDAREDVPGIGKRRCPVPVEPMDVPTDVVGVTMGQQHSVHPPRRDPCRRRPGKKRFLQVVKHRDVRAPLAVAGGGADQDRMAGRAHQPAMDALDDRPPASIDPGPSLPRCRSSASGSEPGYRATCESTRSVSSSIRSPWHRRRGRVGAHG